MAKECIYDEVELVPKKSGSSFGSALKGLLIGSLIGAGVALLTSPHSGETNRNMLMQKGNDLKDKAVNTAQQTANNVQDRVNQIRGQGQSSLSSQKGTISSTVQSIKEGVKQGVRSYKGENQTGNAHSSKEDEVVELTPTNPESFNSVPMDKEGNPIVPEDQASKYSKRGNQNNPKDTGNPL